TRSDRDWSSDVCSSDLRKYTKQVHLRLYTAHLTPEKLDSVRGLVERFPGKCPLFLCLMQPGGERIFIETHDKYFVTPSSQLQQRSEERRVGKGCRSR